MKDREIQRAIRTSIYPRGTAPKNYRDYASTVQPKPWQSIVLPHTHTWSLPYTVPSKGFRVQMHHTIYSLLGPQQCLLKGALHSHSWSPQSTEHKSQSAIRKMNQNLLLWKPPTVSYVKCSEGKSGPTGLQVCPSLPLPWRFSYYPVPPECLWGKKTNQP